MKELPVSEEFFDIYSWVTNLYGISILDAEGNLKPLADVLGELSSKLEQGEIII